MEAIKAAGEIPNLYVADFIKDMATAYSAADLVISRAGAGSISEFCLLNKPVILVPSPKVATYDLKPEMSAYEVKDKLVAAINENKYDFIVVNYANGDMVGHTGIYEAIEKAVVAVDACVKETVEAAKAQGYEAIIIADHGNADHALNDGTPNTAHSLNPVPCVYVTENKNAKVENGRLADVAPTILKIMGLEVPAEMNGKVLIK